MLSWEPKPGGVCLVLRCDNPDCATVTDAQQLPSTAGEMLAALELASAHGWRISTFKRDLCPACTTEVRSMQ